MLGDRICEFHAKDYGHVLFGQGKVDWRQVRRGMDAIRYRGWIQIEANLVDEVFLLTPPLALDLKIKSKRGRTAAASRRGLAEMGDRTKQPDRSDAFPFVGDDPGLLENAFCQRPVHVAPVGIGDVDFQGSFAHERMLAPGIGPLPSQRLEPAKEFPAGDRFRHVARRDSGHRRRSPAAARPV